MFFSISCISFPMAVALKQGIFLPAVLLLALLLTCSALWLVLLSKNSYVPPPALTGRYARNDLLKRVTPFARSAGLHPEDIAFDAEGRVYASAENGCVFRFAGTEDKGEVVANTAGRPLGLAVKPDGDLIIADAVKGLLCLSASGLMSVLATRAAGQEIVFANAVCIARDGIVYFSQSSDYLPTDHRSAWFTGRQAGRLLAFDPATRTARVVLDNLRFPNGVALSPDESFLLIAETSAYRVIRYWLKGRNRGQTDIFIDNLPGVPDNISCNGREIFWLAMFARRDADFEWHQAHPWIGRFLDRLPFRRGSMFSSPPYGFVLGLDLDGRVAYNLQDSSGAVASGLTSAREHRGVLYFGCVGLGPIRTLPVADLPARQ